MGITGGDVNYAKGSSFWVAVSYETTNRLRKQAVCSGKEREGERKENGDAETDRSKCSVKRESCILISLRCQLSCVTQKAILCGERTR